MTRAQDMLAKRGKDITLRTWSDPGTKDSEGDPEWDLSEASIPAIKEMAGGSSGASTERTGMGQETSWDAVFHVADADVNAAALANDATRPGEIEDADGVSFQVEAISEEELGYRRLFCEKMRG